MCAVLDTGIMKEHPVIKGKIIKQIDFTGEGVEDLNGHGTIVALIIMHTSLNTKLINVKVLDKNNNGYEDDLIAGMIWAAKQGADVIGISAGIERECNGECLLCRIANTIVAMYDTIITTAAGNNPNTTSCPAKAESVFSFGATDYKGKKIAGYSSKADFYSPGALIFEPKREVLCEKPH